MIKTLLKGLWGRICITFALSLCILHAWFSPAAALEGLANLESLEPLRKKKEAK